MLADIEFTYLLLWAGSFALSVTLVVLLWTRWGHSRPLHKCAALSLIVHLILVFLTMTVRIVHDGDGSGGGGGGGPIHVRIVEDAGQNSPVALAMVGATEQKIAEKSEVAPPPLLEPPAKPEDPKPTKEVEKTPDKADPQPRVVDALPQPAEPATIEKPPVADVAIKNANKQTADAPKNVAEHQAVPAREPAHTTGATATGTSAAPTEALAAVPASIATPTTPTETATAAAPSSPYALRNSPGRLGLVAGQGGNAETETAVAAALKWLASVQSRDGRWDAMKFGAGQEELVLGQNRGGAGRGADAGVTALAVLAFLGAGHSHVQGPYQENVRRGLDFLLRSQAADGSLFGDATLYAQMYCHSMATFALAEAQAVTRDRRLEAAVTKSVNFSLAAQNTSTGGWRYRPGDTGDTSQLGWQIMALASAHRAGLKVPDQTWSRVDRFLRSVERGSTGGLASYRPDSPASTSMTAEALYCRVVLEEMSGVKLSEAAVSEATTQLLASPPSAERFNLYYWYYATLALHHRQNSSDAAKTAWRTWNEAMTATLTKSQVTEGDAAGSWEANTMWGGYGGRIYTTAIATMCLEVYYRYTPAAAPVRQGEWSAVRLKPGAATR